VLLNKDESFRIHPWIYSLGSNDADMKVELEHMFQCINNMR